MGRSKIFIAGAVLTMSNLNKRIDALDKRNPATLPGEQVPQAASLYRL